MKRSYLAFPALSLAVLLSSCGGEVEETAKPASAATSTAAASQSATASDGDAWSAERCEEASMADWTEHCSAEVGGDSSSLDTPTAPTETALGGTYQGERADITVQVADANVSSKGSDVYGADGAARVVTVDFTAANKGAEVMEAYNFITSATFAGQALQIATVDGSGSGPGGDILPGRTGKWTIAYAVPAADPGELIVSMSFGLGGNIYFTGTV